MTSPAKCNITIGSNLPKWLEEIRLENAVRKQVGHDFEKILNINIENVSKEGENYSSLVLRVEAKVQLKNQTQKTVSFILKTSQPNERVAQMLDLFRIFPKEEEMYHKILPRFEQFYRDTGNDVQFAPKAFKFDIDMNKDYVLLEDLGLKKYKNVNRVRGLDTHHTLEVLKKMAQYHAASACYVERYGSFGTDFTVGVFSEKNREILRQFNNSTAFLNQLRNWNWKTKYEKLADSDMYLVDRLLEDQKVNTGEFNVLNHGDCWTNNIMFQYDKFTAVKNVLFVDFALGKYGSPANDLYYFILSSVAADIKLFSFDRFVRYYYDHLIDNLKMLEYPRPLPKLTSIHCSLLNNGLAAYMTVTKVLPAVILEKSDSANLENYINDQSKMVNAMFTNPNYKTAMSDILGWLDNRGLLDWK